MLFLEGDFKGQPINALQTQSFAIVILDTCFRVPDDLKTNTFNYQVQGSTTLDTFQNSINLAGNYYIDYRSTDLTPLVDRELTTKYYVDEQIGTRQPTIDTDTDLTSNTLTTTGNADIGNDLTLTGTQINFNSDSFISNTAGGNSGNHLVIFINGTEYKIKLENAS